MAVVHVASAVANTTTGTTTDTITIPASVVAGHDLYVVWQQAGAGTATVTDDDSGGNTWTKLGTPVDAAQSLWWKKATSGTASKTVTIAGALDSITGGLSVFSGGLASGDPTTNLGYESNVSGNEVHAGFTPSFADSMICFGVGHFDTIAINPVTLLACTNPGSLEPELWERSSTGGNDCYAIFTAGVQVGGPTATGNFTWAMINASSRSLVFAIRPEVAITGTGASTLAGVTSAGSGTFIAAITGTGASTLDGVTSAGSGIVANPITGTGASTLAGVTSAGVGVATGMGPIPGRGCCGGRRRCCRRDRVSA